MVQDLLPCVAMKVLTCSSALSQRPSKQYALGLFPTPIHRWYPPGIPEDMEFWIKRDDLTGCQLSGNKASHTAAIPYPAEQATQSCNTDMVSSRHAERECLIVSLRENTLSTSISAAESMHTCKASCYIPIFFCKVDTSIIKVGHDSITCQYICLTASCTEDRLHVPK